MIGLFLEIIFGIKVAVSKIFPCSILVKSDFMYSTCINVKTEARTITSKIFIFSTRQDKAVSVLPDKKGYILGAK